MKLDIDKIEQIIREAAAEKIMPYYKKLSVNDIEIKSKADDFVTIADKESEKFITSALKKSYPDAVIIGEESVSENPLVFNDIKNGDLGFIIDPVDGTWNFKNNIDDFAVLVGCVFKGEIIAGFCYMPVYNKITIVEKNSGTYTNGVMQKINGKLLNPTDLIGFYHQNPGGLDKAPVQLHTTRCGAYVYQDIIENKVNFNCHLSDKTCPWDHVVGILSVNEAGGYAKSLPDVDYDYTRMDNKIVVADCYENFEQLRKYIRL